MSIDVRSRLTVLCVLLHILVTSAFEAQITRKSWVTDKIVKIQDEFQADNIFSYALCREEKQWGYVNLSCKVVLETFAKNNVVLSNECRSSFNKTFDSLLHIRFANRDRVILTSLQQTDNPDEFDHVIRIIDVPSCQSRDIRVTLNQELLELSSVQGTKIFMRSDKTFEIIYDAPGQLCDNDICAMSFNSEGKVLRNFQPISRQRLPVDESVAFDVPYGVIFKYLYPLAIGSTGQTEYFVITLQTSGDLPLPYISDRPVLITLLKADSRGYEVLETLEFDCYGFDRQKFIDIDASKGFLSVCFKDYKAYGPTMMRCRQFDENWRKTLEVDRVINNNNVNAIKVKTLRKGELLLATHENEGPRSERVYVRRIEGGGRHEAPIFVSDAGNSRLDPWSIDYFTNFYEDRERSFCLMGWHLSYTPNYYQNCEITRMCFSKQLIV